MLRGAVAVVASVFEAVVVVVVVIVAVVVIGLIVAPDPVNTYVFADVRETKDVLAIS